MQSGFLYMKGPLASKLIKTTLSMKVLLPSLLLMAALLPSLLLMAALLAEPVSAASPALLMPVAAQAPTVSESAAVASAVRAVKGRVLSVQLIDSRGPPVYRVKILTADGRVRTVHVDGQTGEVISY